MIRTYLNLSIRMKTKLLMIGTYQSLLETFLTLNWSLISSNTLLLSAFIGAYHPDRNHVFLTEA